MIEDVRSYRKKCLFPVLLFFAMVTSAQIDFPQILGVVYPGMFLPLVLSTVIPLLACCTSLNIYLFLVTKLSLSELGSSSSVDCSTVGINCFDTGAELDRVLACFRGKVVEMRAFFFEGKISFVFGCD